MQRKFLGLLLLLLILGLVTLSNAITIGLSPPLIDFKLWPGSVKT